jgi:hypothetical protein
MKKQSLEKIVKMNKKIKKMNSHTTIFVTITPHTQNGNGRNGRNLANPAK